MSAIVSEKVKIEDIAVDESVQTRARECGDTIALYAALLEESEEWPFEAPVILFKERKSGTHYIGDGFHRLQAALQAGHNYVVAEVREGGEKEALRYALGSNNKHGLRRTRKDVERVVMLARQEFPEMSQRDIAKVVSVPLSTVRRHWGDYVGAAEKKVEEKGGGEAQVVGSAVGVDDLAERSSTVGSGTFLEGGIQEEREEVKVRIRLADVVPLTDLVATAEPGVTWGELLEGSGIEEESVELAVARAWLDGEDEGVPRCVVLRDTPVSWEHAERQRVAQEEALRLKGDVEWFSGVLGKIERRSGMPGSSIVVLGVENALRRQILRHVDEKAVSLAARFYGLLKEDFVEKYLNGYLEFSTDLALLLATEILMNGREGAERVLGEELLEFLK